MTTTLTESAGNIADEIIALSITLQDRMLSWADVVAHNPDSSNAGVTAGYITDWTRPNVMELLVEAQAAPDATTALVRTQAIETSTDESGNERWNQVSVHFAVDYDKARQLVEKGGATTRQEIAALLHDPSSQLARVIVSDETGKDATSGQELGNRYDLTSEELASTTEAEQQDLQLAIAKVLAKLQATAEREANL